MEGKDFSIRRCTSRVSPFSRIPEVRFMPSESSCSRLAEICMCRTVIAVVIKSSSKSPHATQASTSISV